MKKTIFVLLWVLFGLTTLYPAGVIITACFGYDFELFSISAFAVALAMLSLCILILDLVLHNTIANKILRVLLAMITPLALINAVFYMITCPQIWVVASVLLSAGCCCYLTAKHGKPLALKIISLILSALMILPIGFCSFLLVIFGNIGETTVVKTVASPNGKYYAHVIDSDQGALGGDTLVNVYQDCGVDLLLFKIEKKPQQVYFGDWGKFKNMQIHWKNDHCLVIDSVEYEIE